MKELTTEQKAQRYDEAIKKSKGVIEQNPLIEYLKIEYIFPELKESEESEDERMIKSINRLVKAFYDCNFPTPEGFERKDLLDWLEKQGGQPKEATYTHEVETGNGNIKALVTEKVQLPKFKVGDIIKSKKNGDTVKVKHILSDSYCFSDWDGAVTIHSISDQDNWELVEQKAAWSEEDEINLEKAIWYVENPAPMVVKDSMLVEWLKSLKDRVQPQPKQEWSEEDEVLLKFSLENLIELKDRFGKEYGKVGDCINWLKSLKDRYSWKPSDEQMETLKYACGGNYVNLRILESLYKDLKQLKQL